jgi:endonuclease YncB( thermonuclease family)
VRVYACIFLAALTITCRAETRSLAGRVTAVADGDSFVITDAARHSYRVRLLGIDAPERHQSFSAASKRQLSNTIFGRDIVVTSDKVDQYGRIVGSVVVNGHDVALDQVRAGMAWVYVHYQGQLSPNERAAYTAAQRSAKEQHAGIWSEPSPVPPWQFRRAARPPGRR